MTVRKILVPINRSEYSREILSHVQRLMPAAESELILFYATKPPRGLGGIAAGDISDAYLDQVGGPGHPIYPQQQEESLRSEIKASLTPLMQQLKDAGYQVGLQVSFTSELVEEITRVVKRQEIDLIAMSTKARVGLQRFFFHDLADQVSIDSNVPLLLIHPQEK